MNEKEAKKRRHLPHKPIHPIVEFLRVQRITQRMTQRELGKKAGYEHSTIAHLEVGSVNPVLPTVIAVASVLGFDVVVVPKGGRDGK